MSHNLLIENNKASMMYYDEVPWHGLGTRLDRPATSQEAIEAANLNWLVEKKPLYLKFKPKVQVNEAFAIVRKDHLTKNEPTVLGVVGKNYKPVQNHEAFEFFDDIVGAGKAIYHTAGALSDGKIIWILAKLPGYIRVVGDDITHKYLLLSNSHDGSTSVQIKFTPIRVVCNNTLTIALNKGETLKAKHTRDVKERLTQAKELLGIIDNRFNGIEKSFREMAQVKVNQSRLNEYLKNVFPDPQDELLLPNTIKAREMAQELFETGIGAEMQGVKGTLWGAYNGITEMIDHKNTRLNADKKSTNILFGAGYNTKVKAYNVALDKMKYWMN